MLKFVFMAINQNTGEIDAVYECGAPLPVDVPIEGYNNHHFKRFAVDADADVDANFMRARFEDTAPANPIVMPRMRQSEPLVQRNKVRQFFDYNEARDAVLAAIQ